ncbi:MAG: gamma-glutamylcyclotransferase [Novosphingobium sp.]|uniref:gamma-glutamylcyclotransferase family protein n=1 Tax=Novosphingobium sp. TaxID=1874826 RepID=UPI00301AAB51
MTIDHRLATYGTLAPGRVNHHQLAGLAGEWTVGTIRGRLVETGWGAALGYPALVLDEGGEAIAVHLFSSADLPKHWARLDAFEGAEYRRGEVMVETAAGLVPAWIYLAADGSYSS